MTFDEYVANPMGRSNAVMSSVARESQKKTYKEKFDALLVRENGNIQYTLYVGSGEVYYAHIKIPSETVRDFYYDTVIKFTGDAFLATSGLGLNSYQVQFYSNDPAFVYTYAYVFKKHNLLIPELETKMAKKAVKTPAREKNPDNQVGYVKSIYFAYTYMKSHGLFNKSRYIGAPVLTKKLINENIEPADRKVQQRQELGEELKERKRAVSRSGKDQTQAVAKRPKNANSLQVAATKTVGAVKNVSNKMKKTKSTKKF